MLAKLEQQRGPWRCVVDRRGVVIWLKGKSEPLILLEDGYGAIIGPLFDARGAVSRIETTEALRLIESGGSVLIGEYWGAYSAFLHDRGRDRFHVVRDPAAARPLYWAELPEGPHAVFSHASDFVAAGGAVSVDEHFLAAFLARPRLVTSATALKGVNELLAGQRISFSREQWRVEEAWAPDSPSKQARALRFEDAAATLREVVTASAGCWAQGRDRIVHRLSGGLDSSIALAALRRAGADDICCVNFFPADAPEGDERAFARIAARHFGVPLEEVEFSPERVDYARLAGIEFMAKPSLADLSFADVNGTQAIVAMAPDLVTSGQGGDQLFQRARHVAIAAEAIRDGKSWAECMRIALDTARLVRRPVWDVLTAMLEHGFLRRSADPASGWAGSSLTGERARAAADALWRAHPWRARMLALGPARAQRLAHISGLHFYHEQNAVAATCASAPMLASQPVIEFCLAVPPYVMTEGGSERALARAAFASELPDEIATRRGKGSTTRFHARVLERQLPLMREMLLGGALHRRGLLQADALGRALARDVVADVALKDALTTAFVAEMWLRRLDAIVAETDARSSQSAPAGA